MTEFRVFLFSSVIYSDSAFTKTRTSTKVININVQKNIEPGGSTNRKYEKVNTN